MNHLSEWLGDFYVRFDSDIQLLLNEEPFWKVCHSCPDGYCCQKEIVPVMSLEWHLITRYVKEEFSKQSKNRLLENVETKRPQCPFLFSHRCAIYPVRPWACRTYPYTISFQHSPLSLQSGGIVLPRCPTLAPLFQIEPDTIVSCQPEVLDRHESGKIVKCQLPKHQALWLIDASSYFHEYLGEMPKDEVGIPYYDTMNNLL